MKSLGAKVRDWRARSAMRPSASEILHRRFFEGKPEKEALLEKERQKAKAAEKFYYKVVYKDAASGSLSSACKYYGRYGNLGLYSDAILDYRPGRWTTPKLKGSKLFCFRTLRMARVFKKTSLQLGPRSGEAKFTCIWKCKAKNPEPAGQVAAVLTEEAVQYFWNRRRKRPQWYSEIQMHDAMRADALKLVSEV